MIWRFFFFFAKSLKRFDCLSSEALKSCVKASRKRLVSALKVKTSSENTIAGAHLLQARGEPFEDRRDAFGGQSKKLRSLPTMSLCATRLNATPAPLVTDSFSGKLNSH